MSTTSMLLHAANAIATVCIGPGASLVPPSASDVSKWVSRPSWFLPIKCSVPLRRWSVTRIQMEPGKKDGWLWTSCLPCGRARSIALQEEHEDEQPHAQDQPGHEH